jgi:hypothetical protein
MPQTKPTRLTGRIFPQQSQLVMVCQSLFSRTQPLPLAYHPLGQFAPGARGIAGRTSLSSGAQKDPGAWPAT